ncbi:MULTISPECIES: CBS domain-containing protein [Calditerrivibrio]|uniref:CBS domain-containing protein n=1 Tax=Calditerrivibrio TaxID=545865 RepID=UPI003C74DE4E
MKIVITHHNPDFDALSSAYAAMKLYSCDKIFISNTLEGNVGRFLEENDFGIPYIKATEKFIDEFKENIELLIITDCKIKNRLKYLSKLIDKSDKIIIFDHHQTDNIDIATDELYLEKIGASTSIIVKRLKKNGVYLSKEEATLLMMGIYEDTGFLSFNTTTPDDLLAAAYLLEHGADLNLVSEYVKRELSKEQVLLLNELIINTTVLIIDKLFIGITHANTDEFFGDIAFLAHKLIEMENFDAIFLLVRTGDRVVIVGRSKSDKIDISRILYYFGGGGHPYAGSAIVKDITLNEAIPKLKNIINEQIYPMKYARDLMTSPVKYVSTGEKIADAFDLFMKYNLNVMPVVKNGKTIGLILRRDILHSMKHELQNEPVDSIMQIEFDTASPDTPIDEIKDIMLLKNQKMVPIEINDTLVGVITRTDLLRLMREEIVKMPRFVNEKAEVAGLFKSRNVADLLKDRLPEYYYNLLKQIGAIADELDLNAYVVGGFVRDLLMKYENFDVDIVVELDATILAQEFARRNNGRVAIHDKFKTAVVILPDRNKLDFATARTEYYNMPASAPEVEISSIKNDLFRRDFTINAMAIKINEKTFGLLLDFYGGQRDIIDKKIRVLHNLSFIDDPSRGLRAIRFAVRYNFEIGPHTNKLLKNAINLKLFDKIPGNRLFLETKYILSESNYLDAIKMMTNYGIMKFYIDKFKLDDLKLRIFENFERYLIWHSVQCNTKVEPYIVRLLILFSDLKNNDFQKICDRFELSRETKKKLLEGYGKSKHIANKIKKSSHLKRSDIYYLFEGLNEEFLLFTASILGYKYEQIIRDYITEIRWIKPEIDGNDLRKLGIPPSQIYQKIFKQLTILKLDGIINSKDEELKKAIEIYEELKNAEEKNLH